MRILTTVRLTLDEATLDDAAFVLELLNEPSFLRFIGDRGVRTLEAARSYIDGRLIESYARHGFGLYLVRAKPVHAGPGRDAERGEPVGLCGLVRREGLDDVDIGFAFLPAHWGRGFAFEAASAVLTWARDVLGLERVVALTALDNARSARLLEKLGLRFERIVRLTPGGEESRLFVPPPAKDV